jgi:cyclopropane-fatty-acyl-phospholipid synthase
MNRFDACLDEASRSNEASAIGRGATPDAIAALGLPRLQQIVLTQLSKIQGGLITVRLPGGGAVTVGTPASDELHVSVTISSEQCFREIAFGGSLGAAEAYLQGLWETDDLVTLMRIFSRNLDRPETIDSWWSRIGLAAARFVHWMARNSRRGSRRNIAAHYDLSNEFFELFLDPTMLYSSGLFTAESQLADQPLPADPQLAVAHLQAASVEKIDRACRTLGLRAGDRLLEIGTGWGALAEHAALNYGCTVTTTTISRQQWEYARARIERAGLSARVTLLFEDYRDLPAHLEPFDHLVSIEMIEAVGHRYLPRYFETCARLVRPGGRVLIQAITMPDARYERYRRSVDFIQKYVFPGGHLPSVGRMQACADRTGRLTFQAACEFPDSYALTLRTWRRRFHERLDDVRRLGFDDRFIRLWEYYLCYCEGAFLERAVGVGQFVWTRTR